MLSYLYNEYEGKPSRGAFVAFEGCGSPAFGSVFMECPIEPIVSKVYHANALVVTDESQDTYLRIRSRSGVTRGSSLFGPRHSEHHCEVLAATPGGLWLQQ